MPNGAEYLSECDVIKFKTVAIFMHGVIPIRGNLRILGSLQVKQAVCEFSCWHKNVDLEFLNFGQNSHCY